MKGSAALAKDTWIRKNREFLKNNYVDEFSINVQHKKLKFELFFLYKMLRFLLEKEIRNNVLSAGANNFADFPNLFIYSIFLSI